jgi:hypothetical protein
MRRTADQVALHIERIVNGRVDGNKALSRFGEFEALHRSFASSKRPMQVLRSIVGAKALLVQPGEANFTKRGSVGPQFVGDDRRRRKGMTSEQFPNSPQRRGLIASRLDQDFEDIKATGASSLREIAAGLNSRGIPTARGGRRSAVQVSRVLMVLNCKQSLRR